jgi:hypothetical protein
MRENVDLSNLAREPKCSLFFVPTPKFPEERIRLNATNSSVIESCSFFKCLNEMSLAAASSLV